MERNSDLQHHKPNQTWRVSYHLNLCHFYCKMHKNYGGKYGWGRELNTRDGWKCLGAELMLKQMKNHCQFSWIPCSEGGGFFWVLRKKSIFQSPFETRLNKETFFYLSLGQGLEIKRIPSHQANLISQLIHFRDIDAPTLPLHELGEYCFNWQQP